MKELDLMYAEPSLYTVAEMEKMIFDYLAEVSYIAAEGINRSCSLTNDISLDSLDKMELLMWCEKTFVLAIDDSEATKINTVGDILDTVRRKKTWRGE